MREIISGLTAGERVASSALFLIDSEAQLKGVVPASGPSAPQEKAPEHAGHQH
jgi:Cu(I)/Ag(I) efflux system membrane fusion protein